jgi:hypothetical protein
VIGLLVNNELERIWKEMVVARFEVVFWNLSGVIEENIRQDNHAVAEI